MDDKTTLQPNTAMKEQQREPHEYTTSKPPRGSARHKQATGQRHSAAISTTSQQGLGE